MVPVAIQTRSKQNCLVFTSWCSYVTL